MWPDLGAVRDGLIFNLLNMIGGILWTIDRIMLMIASILHWFRVLLVGGGGQDNLLGILMTQMLQGNELLKQLVYLGLMLALTILAFTLIARPLIGRFQAVDFQRVVLWLFVAVLIFSAGPGMVAGLEGMRLGLQEQAHLLASTIQYQNEVGRFNNGVVPDRVGDFWLPGQTPGYVPHLFGTSVGSDCPSGCNGLDAASAFLGAEEGDITGARAEARNTGGYPAALYERYFTWREGTEEERAASVRNASEGVMRLLEGVLPAFFGILEALIFLFFGIAAMVLFISLPAALPFAFFSLTEVIAASVVRAYLFLVLRTFVVATMLAFLVQMLIIFAERGTVLVFVSISALTMLLSFQFVHMAAQTVTGAFNVIGSAVGSATGVSARQVDPFAAAGRVAGMAALAGAAVATGGGALAGAATLLHRQGGVRGGGLGAVGSAALHAARVRAGAALKRTPLSGLERGYSAVHTSHQMSRERQYELESMRALLLDRDAEEAAAILMEQRSVSPARNEWANRKVRQWTASERSRQRYRTDMRKAGMSRLAYRGYSRPWKVWSDSAASGTHTGVGGPIAGSVAPSTVENRGTAREERASTALEHSGQGAGAAELIPQKQLAFAEGSAELGDRSGDREPGPPALTGPGMVTELASSGSNLRLKRPTQRPSTASSRLLKAVDSALRAEDVSVGLVRGKLVVYNTHNSSFLEDEKSPRAYELVPPDSDLVDLLSAGKHILKSSKHAGHLVAWVPDNKITPRSHRNADPLDPFWLGTDESARRAALASVRGLVSADQRDPVSSAPFAPLNAELSGSLRGHLSRREQEQLRDMAQSGRVLPATMLRVLELADEAATTIEASGHTQLFSEEFLSPGGYLDLESPGVMSILSAAGLQLPHQARGSDIRLDSAHISSSPISDAGPLPSDVALLISTGLGLKRAVPWDQVKSAMLRASLTEGDPVRAVMEVTDAPSLRTSMAPIKRFVSLSRAIELQEEDQSTLLDVASATHDIGGILSGLKAKEAGARHKLWHAAGVPAGMMRPLERANSNILRRVESSSQPGTPRQKSDERAQELLGSLLTEGVAIRDELESVPIETYSFHPFTLGGIASGAAKPTGVSSLGFEPERAPIAVPLAENGAPPQSQNTGSELPVSKLALASSSAGQKRSARRPASNPGTKKKAMPILSETEDITTDSTTTSANSPDYSDSQANIGGQNAEHRS